MFRWSRSHWLTVLSPRYGFFLLADCAARTPRLHLRDGGYREHTNEENRQDEMTHRSLPTDLIKKRGSRQRKPRNVACGFAYRRNEFDALARSNANRRIYLRLPVTAMKPFVPSRRVPSRKSVSRSVYPGSQSKTTLLFLQDQVPNTEVAATIIVPVGLMVTSPPGDHDQTPGILLHDEVSALRTGLACLCNLGTRRIEGVSSAPDCDLFVFPREPPVEPAWPKANGPPAKNMMIARRDLVAIPLIRVPQLQSFVAANG
jgi:hypothetical protein